MLIRKLGIVLPGFLFLLFGNNVFSAPPTTGAYSTDSQQEFVQDQATESISTAQQIMCFMYNVRADLMVNAGQYIAFIDEAACNTSGRASASNSSNSSASGTTSYTRMSMLSTKATVAADQIVKGHAEIVEEDGAKQQVYIHTNSSEGPSATAPNGIMTLNFTGLNSAGNRVFRGELAVNATGMTFSESGDYGSGEESIRLYVDGTDSSGSGAVVAPNGGGGTDTITFGYNSSYFCRVKNAGTERCFSRSKAQADSTVWQYGTYDDSTGAQFDLAQPGFSIKDSGGKYGFASYWGVWLPTTPSDGATVTNTAGDVSYTVKQGKGRMMKFTRVQTTLDAIKKVPFVFRSEASTTIASTAYSAGTEFEAYWDDANDNFAVTGTQNCGSSGCFMNKISDATLTAAALKTLTTSGGNAFGVRGWSRGLGGQIQIKAAALSDSDPGASANGVRYMTEVVVAPGDSGVPTTFKCVRDCMTDASLDVISSSDSPFTAGTYNQWGNVGAGAVETYTWSTSNYSLTDSTSAVVNSTALPTGNLSGNYQWGVRTGPLVASSDLASLQCDWDASKYCDWKANDLSTYYVWETGTQNWNTATFLKNSDDTYVDFTAPQGASFTVPANTSGTTPYGDFAGAPLRLEFMGFGQLHGIPGKCFSSETNAEVDCGDGTRYVPAFTIPSDSNGYVTIDSATKWIKWLERELRFKPESGITSAGQSITMGATSSLPAAQVLTGDAKDPSMSSNTTYYPGAYSGVNWDVAPAVIQGVKQP